MGWGVGKNPRKQMKIRTCLQQFFDPLVQTHLKKNLENQQVPKASPCWWKLNLPQLTRCPWSIFQSIFWCRFSLANLVQLHVQTLKTSRLENILIVPRDVWLFTGQCLSLSWLKFNSLSKLNWPRLSTNFILFLNENPAPSPLSLNLEREKICLAQSKTSPPRTAWQGLFSFSLIDPVAAEGRGSCGEGFSHSCCMWSDLHWRMFLLEGFLVADLLLRSWSW